MHNRAMRNPWIKALAIFLALAAFLASTRLASLEITYYPSHGLLDRLLIRFGGKSPRDVHLLLYAVVHLSLLGAALPLTLAWLLKLPLWEPRNLKRLLLGLVLALGLAAAAVVRSDLSWSAVSHQDYKPFLKYLFYYASLGLAICLYGFYLVPEALAGLVRHPIRKHLLSLLGCGAVLHLVEKFEILPLGNTPPDEMVWYGLAVFVARLLAGSPAVALPAVIGLLFALCFPARGEYLATAWKPMLAAFLLSFWSLCLFLNTRTKKRFPPETRTTPKVV